MSNILTTTRSLLKIPPINLNKQKDKTMTSLNNQEYRAARLAEHHAKYGALVTPSIISLVEDRIGVERIKNSTDEHFNDIPLREWDHLAKFIDMSGPLATKVCIFKAAARVIKARVEQ